MTSSVIVDPRRLAAAAVALGAALAAPALAAGPAAGAVASPWSQPADVPGGERANLSSSLSFGLTGVGALSAQTAARRPVIVPIRSGAVGAAEPLRGAVPDSAGIARVYGDGRLVSLATRRGRVLAAFGSVEDGLGRARRIGTHTRGYWAWTVNARGDVAATFTDAEGVKLAYRPAGRRFREPVLIARVRRATYVPRPALSPGGSVLVTWQNERVPGIRGRRPGIDSLYARRVARSGRLGPVQRIADVRGVAAGNAALSDGGRAVVVWQDELTGETRVARAGRGEPFAPSQQLEPPGGSALPTGAIVRMTATGEAVVAWIGTSDGGRSLRVSDLRGGSFTPARTLSTPGVRAALGGLAVGPRGDALVVWEEGDPSSPKLGRAAARPAGADFGPAETIADREGSGPIAAIDPQSGTPYAFWIRYGEPSNLRYATRAPIG